MIVFSIPCAHDVHMILQASSHPRMHNQNVYISDSGSKISRTKLVRTRKPALFRMPAEADMQVCNKQLQIKLSLS